MSDGRAPKSGGASCAWVGPGGGGTDGRARGGARAGKHASVLSVLRAGGARPSAVGAADLLCGGRDPGCRHSGMWVGKNQELRPYEGL